ncbi:MAG: hypothetical protein WDN75_13875 [Bacteroidota bacterium]
MLGDRFDAGVNVAFVPVETTTPETGVVPDSKVNLEAFIVAGSITALKVAEILLLTAIPVALLIGSVEVTAGSTPATSSFLQPVINTTNNIAMQLLVMRPGILVFIFDLVFMSSLNYLKACASKAPAGSNLSDVIGSFKKKLTGT